MGVVLGEHVRVHVAPLAHSTVQCSVHVMLQVELAAHVTLALAPTVNSQVAPAAQVMSTLDPVFPEQWELAEQVACEVVADTSQAVPVAHVHAPAVHAQPAPGHVTVTDDEPHAENARQRAIIKAARTKDMRYSFQVIP